ncbi:hypothetical protein AVHY2522_23365 [Acidovorax sp. SUPP2522]|uniref:hypothetical protein n=1 Tax=unclassified Acidovorax TaxID=2684926 RepID=UPI00234A1CE7|nr:MULTISPECIES: hypothetical protein [unclassified Acidovorax]WCM96064.1 hypothetical protein M5C96_16610 [Acidovorax sp. GBBC 1281]GKT19682.1 hypothetical protein AVHY2522_23365 [Acidovorax sp. SUPP2522]
MSPPLPFWSEDTPATKTARVKPNDFARPGPIGNCVGCILPKTSPSLSEPNDQPETKEESWWEWFKQGVKDAAQYYKDNLSEPLHEFGANAMDTGGKVAMAGGVTAAAGGAVAATGIGAPVGAGMATVGGATATAGGVVAGVGAGTDSAATALDSAADWVITGETPDMVQPALELGERLLTGMVLKKVPGAGTGARSQKSNRTGGASPPPGGYIPGTGGPCIVGTYDDIRNKCGPTQQAHHIIPDTLARTSNRAQGSKGIGRIPGMATFGGGPSICLQGNARTEGSEHNTAHQCDDELCQAAKRTDNGPVGTLPVSEAVPVAMKAAIAARPDCKAQIEAEVRKAYPNFENDNRSMNGAGKPPEGDAKAHLENGGTTNDNNRRPPAGGRRKR